MRERPGDLCNSRSIHLLRALQELPIRRRGQSRILREGVYTEGWTDARDCMDEIRIHDAVADA